MKELKKYRILLLANQEEQELTSSLAWLHSLQSPPPPPLLHLLLLHLPPCHSQYPARRHHEEVWSPWYQHCCPHWYQYHWGCLKVWFPLSLGLGVNKADLGMDSKKG